MSAASTNGISVQSSTSSLTHAEQQVVGYANSNLPSGGETHTTTTSPTGITHVSQLQGSTGGDKILKAFAPQKTIDVVHPQALSSNEKTSSSSGQNYSTHDNTMNSFDNLGTSLSSVLEGVHDKTISYEQTGVSGTGGSGGAENLAISQERDALKPSYSTLSNESVKPQSLNDQVNAQIERYTGMMRNGYEYYIFTSMTIDVGKDVSQTASTLTKG